MGDTLEYSLYLGDALTAGGALAAGLLLCEVHEEAGYLDHAGVVAHNDETARADNCANLLGGIKIKGQVEVLLGEAAAGRPADLNGLEVAALYAAADIIYYLTQGRAHRHLDKAGVLDVAGKGKGLRAGAALGANRLIPLCALVDNDGDICKGLDIVKRGRSCKQTLIDASGGLCAGHATLTFDGSGKSRALAADECACAHVDVQVEGLARAHDIVAEDTDSLSVLNGLLQTLDCQRVLCTDIDITLGCLTGNGGDYHTFDHPVGVAFHDGAIHKCAGVALVTVADDVLNRSILVCSDL